MNEDHDIFLAANLGSEITRLLHAKAESSLDRMRGSYERACDIVKEIRANTGSGGQSELGVLQTVLDDLMQSRPVLSVRAETLQAYFLPFVHKVLRI